jgi:aryl-alcohol dehydrogenase-like predicted oxidoreductase
MEQLTTLNGTPAGRFAFGTMQFGGRADEAQSRAMFEACRAAGIVHFDTAYLYTSGASETLLGQFIKDDRESLFVATKVAYAGGATRENMTAQLDVCRQRLDVDTVDALYLHKFDAQTDMRDTMQALAEFRDKGWIRHVGVSNFAAWQVVDAVWTAREFDLRIDLLQPMYSLVKRQAEVELLPMAAQHGVTVASYSPLGGGLLSGKYARGGQGRLTEDERYAARYGQDWMQQTAEDLCAVADELGVHPATLAVAWVAHQETGPVPILSARDTEQLAPSLAALEFDMDAGLYERLSRLSPTPPPATDRLEEQV